MSSAAGQRADRSRSFEPCLVNTVGVEGYDASTYGERHADIYDTWYANVDDTDACVAHLAALAGDPRDGGPILELGIGTGRLAIPLAARGFDVRGIDGSPAMIERLREKPGGAGIPVSLGEMADVVVPTRDDEPSTALGRDGRAVPACRGAFVAYNTFFALTSEDQQRRCFAGVARALEPRGWFVIAAFVPDEQLVVRGSTVAVRSMTADRVVLSADIYDPVAQTISGQYIDIGADGVQLRPFHLRYLRTAQLDEMASEAGFRLADRWAGWSHEPFDETSGNHVSVYRLGGR